MTEYISFPFISFHLLMQDNRFYMIDIARMFPPEWTDPKTVASSPSLLRWYSLLFYFFNLLILAFVHIQSKIFVKVFVSTTST
jgi:hypothetical protein